MRIELLFISLSVVACTGHVPGGGSQGGGGGDGAPSLDDNRGGSGGPTSDEPIPSDGSVESGFVCKDTSTSQTGVPRRIKRLTALEYANTIADLTGTRVVTVDELPIDPVPIGVGFNTFAATLGMSDNEVLAYRRLAEKVAATLRKDAGSALDCPGQAQGSAACGESFALAFAKRAWRRPLEPGEAQAVKDIFNLGRTSLTLADGVAAAVNYALLSPHFLFRSELGSDTQTGTQIALTQHEVATQLSYTLLRTTPSKELLALADAGKLKTKADIAAWVSRLMKDGSAKQAHLAEDFARQWLEVGDPRQVSKDPGVYPKFSTPIFEAMLGEFDAFASKRIWDETSSFAHLFTDKAAALNSTLAGYYGLPDPKSAQFTDIDLGSAGQPRRGILTTGAFTSSHARAADTFVQGRGKTIGTMVMCMDIPAPDPEALAKAALDSTDGKTHRQYLERVLKTPACTGCHRLMDPPGLALEVFDGAGVFRSRWSANEAVDASGTYDATDIKEKFRDIDELSLQIGASKQAARCFSLKSFTYFLGHELTAGDDCTLAKAHAAFEKDGYRIPSLWTALLTSDAMLMRRN